MNTSSETPLSTADTAPRTKTQIHPLHPRSPMTTVIIVAMLILLMGGLLMSFFIEADYTRDEKDWQDKLSLIAQTRASNISLWVQSEQTSIQNIANNPSLKLYVTEWISARDRAIEDKLSGAKPPGRELAEETEEDTAQATFIRNLLVYSAERFGYTSASALSSISRDEANDTGLMLVGNDGLPLIAIPSEKLNAEVLEKLQRFTTGGMSDIYSSPDGAILIGFSEPVAAIQADADSAPIARLIGIKEVTESLRQYLMVGEGIDPQIEVALVKADSGNLQYFTADDRTERSIQIQHIVNNPTEQLEAKSTAQPGVMLKGTDKTGTPVLIISQPIQNTPWQVVVRVAEDHAMAPSNLRRQTLWMTMVVFSVVMALLIVAIWFVATSQRALSNSRHYRNLAKHSSMQEALLKMVANAQPENLFLIDADFRFRYANYHAAKMAGTNIENLMGKSLQDVLGQAKAQTLTALATEAMNTHRTQTLMLSVQKDGKEQTILRTLVPVGSLGLAAETPREDPHVLVIDRDITEVTDARERRMKLNNELIELLVALMDQRDQHANNHSRYVAELAQSIASTMGLKENVQQNVYHAGLLMNVGKMVVPEKWLNSSEPLDDKNIKSIRQSLKASSQLLNKLDFDPAVITALKQAHEHVDGTGLEGLKGHEISVEARIITVANDCISMMSRRAYRNPMSWEDTARNLTNDIDTKYDRGVVAALISYMENQGGKNRIKLVNKKVA